MVQAATVRQSYATLATEDFDKVNADEASDGAATPETPIPLLTLLTP